MGFVGVFIKSFSLPPGPVFVGIAHARGEPIPLSPSECIRDHACLVRELARLKQFSIVFYIAFRAFAFVYVGSRRIFSCVIMSVARHPQ